MVDLSAMNVSRDMTSFFQHSDKYEFYTVRVMTLPNDVTFGLDLIGVTDGGRSSGRSQSRDCGLFVRHIVPGSAASRSPVAVADWLIAVDDVDLTPLSNDHAYRVVDEFCGRSCGEYMMLSFARPLDEEFQRGFHASFRSSFLSESKYEFVSRWIEATFSVDSNRSTTAATMWYIDV